MIYAFCIHKEDPFDSQRYYAHIDRNNIFVCYYTQNSYEKLEEFELPEEYISKTLTKEIRDFIRNRFL